MTTTRAKTARFRELLRAERTFVLPGIFDGISARVADAAGFSALYMTGYGVVASAYGLPDAGLASYSEMVERVRVLAGCVAAPLIADADTGFGGLLNVERTVRGYEAAGAAGVQIEDQEFPKKCGHTEGRRVIDRADAVRKVEVALASRDDSNFVVVARTDARYPHGIDEALRRAEAFLKVGADVLFVESPESLEEMRRIAETFRGAPLLANMVQGGRTPTLTAAELQALGFKIALFPATGFLASAAALTSSYAQLRETGDSVSSTPLHPFAEMNRLMGFADVHAFEAKWK